MYVQIISMVFYTLEEIYDDFCFTNTMNKMGNTEVTVRLFSGNESFITKLFILCNKNWRICIVNFLHLSLSNSGPYLKLHIDSQINYWRYIYISHALALNYKSWTIAFRTTKDEKNNSQWFKKQTPISSFEALYDNPVSNSFQLHTLGIPHVPSLVVLKVFTTSLKLNCLTSFCSLVSNSRWWMASLSMSDLKFCVMTVSLFKYWLDW